MGQLEFQDKPILKDTNRCSNGHLLYVDGMPTSNLVNGKCKCGAE